MLPYVASVVVLIRHFSKYFLQISHMQRLLWLFCILKKWFPSLQFQFHTVSVCSVFACIGYLFIDTPFGKVKILFEVDFSIFF